MIIHQIYFDWGKPYTDTPIFSQSLIAWKAFAEKNGYEYKFHTDELKTKLLEEYPQHKEFVSKLNHPQEHDFLKLLCIHHYGGVYIDMDILPNCEDFKWIKTPLFRHDNGTDKKGEHFNIDFFACEKGEEIIGSKLYESMEQSYNQKKERYLELGWVGRFYLQTTGPYHFTRYIKKIGIDKIHSFDATTYRQNGNEPHFNCEDSKLIVYHAGSWSSFCSAV